MKLFTIGFSKHSAEEFFDLLSTAGVRKVIDTRISPISQLSGFAKQKDLEFFLKRLVKIEYLHSLDMAPTKELLTSYRNREITWDEYEKKFLRLLKSRKIEKSFSPASLNRSCLLCSELLPHYCHRRIVAEYLKSRGVVSEIIHLP